MTRMMVILTLMAGLSFSCAHKGKCCKSKESCSLENHKAHKHGKKDCGDKKCDMKGKKECCKGEKKAE